MNKNNFIIKSFYIMFKDLIRNLFYTFYFIFTQEAK